MPSSANFSPGRTIMSEPRSTRSILTWRSPALSRIRTSAGASWMSWPMALRARSRLCASSHCAAANSVTTIAASSYSLDINVLMVIAVVGALFIGEYEEAAMVVTLFAAAQWLEAQSLDRARKAIGKLIALAPADVLIRNNTGERLVNIDRVDPGSVMIVRPGE